MYCYRNIHCQFSNWINIPLSLFQFYCARLTLRSTPHQCELTLVKGPSPLKTLDIFTPVTIVGLLAVFTPSFQVKMFKKFCGRFTRRDPPRIQTRRKKTSRQTRTLKPGRKFWKLEDKRRKPRWKYHYKDSYTPSPTETLPPFRDTM